MENKGKSKTTTKQVKNRKRQDEIDQMDCGIRERKTKYWFDFISKIVALVISIFLAVIALKNSMSHLPIPPEVKIALPIASGFVGQLPSKIVNLFRKSPP